MDTRMAEVAGSGLPQTCCATLWLWPGRALYLGPSLSLDTHSGSVACLAVGLDKAFAVHGPDGVRTARSALIAPRVRHRLVADGGRMVFCYLEPVLERACRASMQDGSAPIAYRHTRQSDLIRFESAADWVTTAAPGPHSPADERIRAAAANLLADPAEAGSAADFAAAAGLSTSRFLHLFRTNTATSFRRYRLWARMLRVAADLRTGERDLTTAAMDAGFATPSHFSTAFHTMFGLTATALLRTVDTIVVAGPDTGSH